MRRHTFGKFDENRLNTIVALQFISASEQKCLACLKQGSMKGLEFDMMFEFACSLNKPMSKKSADVADLLRFKV